MSPKLFFEKVREAFGLAKKEKSPGNKREDIYQDEKLKMQQDKQPEAGQEKVLRESGGQDISAI